MAAPRRAVVLIGAALLLLNAVQYLVVETVVAMAWPDDGYSYTRDFVSDLGAAASPLQPVMNTSFVMNGVLLLLAALALNGLLERRRGVLVAFAAVYAAGMTGVAAVHSSPDGTHPIHTVGAALALSTGNLIAVLVGLESRRVGAPGWYAAASVALGVAGLIGLVGIPVLSGEYPAAILERVSVYAINAWWMLTGLSLLAAGRTGPPLSRPTAAR